jgi:hypothetical protein
MFQSYTYQYKGYTAATCQCHYKITIIDPDFGKEMLTLVAASSRSRTKMAAASEAGASKLPVAATGVIQFYSSKGYSVNQIAKNLWLLFEFNQRQYSWLTIKKQIEWCLKYLPEYQPYHETIQMLMLFS